MRKSINYNSLLYMFRAYIIPLYGSGANEFQKNVWYSIILISCINTFGLFFYRMLDLFQKDYIFYEMLDLFCTFTESGGCSAAEQLEVVFTARLSSSSFITSGNTLSDIFTIRFGIRGSVELFNDYNVYI